MLNGIVTDEKLFHNGKRKFTSLIFPLRFLMMTLCPILFWVGLISMFFEAFTLSLLFGLILFTVFVFFILFGTRRSNRILNLFASLVVHQFYLLSALFFAPRKTKTWKSIERNAKVLTKQAVE